MALGFHPLTSDRFPDLEMLFGPRGAADDCWCMYWRLRGAAWTKHTGAETRASLRAIVAEGPPPGILAYDDDTPVGWVQVAPRAQFPRFEAAKASRALAGTDPEATYAVNCFFIAKSHRRTGLMDVLLDAAIAFARDQGGLAVEAAPLDVSRKLVWGEGFVGLRSVFDRAGFAVVARQSATRPLMRLIL